MSTNRFFTNTGTPQQPQLALRSQLNPRNVATAATTQEPAPTVATTTTPQIMPTVATTTNHQTTILPEDPNVHNAPKRARIDPTVADPNNGKTRMPLSAAEDFIKSHTASLHTGISTLLLKQGQDYLAIAHKIQSKTRNISRMEEDESYIPISARVNFRLQAMKEVEELNEFKELQQSTNTLISEQQQALKTAIIACAKLERRFLVTKLDKHYCSSIAHTVSLFATAHGLSPALNSAIALSLIDSYSIILLKHHPAHDTVSFRTLFKSLHNIPDEPTALATGTLPIVVELKRIIEAVFVTSWDRYLQQQQENDIALTLKKIAKAVLLEQSTEATVMEIDNELPADRDHLEALIQRSADSIFQQRLDQAINARLSAILGDSKNTPRGPPSRASRKKKTDRSPSPSTRPGRNRGTRPRRTPRDPARSQQTNTRRNPANDSNPSRNHTGRHRNRLRSRSQSRSNLDHPAVDAANATPSNNSRRGNRRSQSRVQPRRNATPSRRQQS